MLKQRIHSTLITFGKPRPATDLFGVAGRKLLDELEVARTIPLSPRRPVADTVVARGREIHV